MPIQIKHDCEVISICYASNDEYMSLTSVSIQSLVDYCDKEKKYEIFILNKTLSNENKEKIYKIVSNHNNVTIEFVNVSKYFTNEKEIPKKLLEKYGIETFFRLVIPSHFANKEKMVYLDGDTLILTDIAELYNIDMKGNIIAAGRDFYGIYECYNPASNRKQYMEKYVKITNINNIFIAGILVFNNCEFNKLYDINYILKLIPKHNWKCHDQDILNYLCKDRTLFIDPSWGVMPQLRFNDYFPAEIKNMYKESQKKSAKIIHYGGDNKPWTDCFSFESILFWKTARKTGYYYDLFDKINTLPIKYLATTGIQPSYEYNDNDIKIKCNDLLIGFASDSPIVLYKITNVFGKVHIHGFIKIPWAMDDDIVISSNLSNKDTVINSKIVVKENNINPYNKQTLNFEFITNNNTPEIIFYVKTKNHISYHCLRSTSHLNNNYNNGRYYLIENNKIIIKTGITARILSCKQKIYNKLKIIVKKPLFNRYREKIYNCYNKHK